MKRVLIGSLAAPSVKAARAVSSGTPSISNMMRPGLTRATQWSGAPLPEPMRTSAGLVETGTSGKMRIQTRPWRFMARVIARRAASICRAVTRSGSSAFRPKPPKDSVKPPLAMPLIRPLWAFRKVVRLGCSISHHPSALRRLLGGTPVLRHRVVGQDLTLEDPDLHAASAVGGLGGRHAVIDIRAQRMQRHAPFAVPFHPGDLGTAEAAAAVDPDAAGAQA